ncbi:MULTISPECIES: response regulator [Actinoplanes]|uniref:response regulator n=1 Tax=Actinoplanes TaxID=1865 RepID=UPI0005F2A412|nr:MULTISPECIES: response regulator [Actinoplanes]GLY04723.1 response regulator [Actinoplanes sp. NBRC 101535]
MTSDTATRPRVLVVDDAATVRMYHTSLLAEGGFQVDEAANGLEAVEAAMTTAYDLFVVDVNMPKMNGYACVEALRSATVGTPAPVVMISTEDRPGDADLAYRAGANLYLVKPVAGDRLVRIAGMLTAQRGVPA